jgi:hypothetical protein
MAGALALLPNAHTIPRLAASVGVGAAAYTLVLTLLSLSWLLRLRTNRTKLSAAE